MIDHRRQLQPCVFQHAVQPIDFLRSILDLPLAIPRQFAQVTDRRRWHQK
jgi:hypothetical protein